MTRPRVEEFEVATGVQLRSIESELFRGGNNNQLLVRKISLILRCAVDGLSELT